MLSLAVPLHPIPTCQRATPRLGCDQWLWTTDDRRPTTDDRRPTTDDRRPTTDDRRPTTGQRIETADEITNGLVR
jgi:hypothetical protein